MEGLDVGQRHPTFRKILIVGFTACLATVGLFSYLAVSSTGWDSYVQSAETKQTIVAESAAMRVHSYLSQYTQALVFVAEEIRHSPSQDSDRLSITLSSVIKAYPWLKSIGVLRVPATGAPSMLTAQEVDSRIRTDTWHPVRTEVINDLRLDDALPVKWAKQTPFSPAPGILIHIPCGTYKSGHVYLVGVVDPAPLRQTQTHLVTDASLSVNILDPQGNVIVGPGTGLRTIKDIDMSRFTAESGVGDFTSADNQALTASYVRVKEYQWVVVAAKLKSQVLHDFQHVLLPLMLWVVVGLIIAIALILWIARRIALPINQLTTDAGTHPRARRSDAFAVPPSSPHEIVQLSQALRAACKRQHDFKQQVFYIVQHAPLLFVVADLNGKITYAAGQLLPLFDMTPEGAVGTSVTSLCSMDESFSSCLSSLVETGDHAWVLTQHAQVIEMRASVIRDEQGKPSYVMFVGIDVSESRIAQHTHQLLSQVRALHEQVLQAGETERQQLAGELHDLVSQDLTAIRAYVMLLLGALPPGDQSEVTRKISGYIREIDATALELQGVVHSMLKRLWPESIDRLGLIASLEDLVGDFRNQHPSITVVMRFPEEAIPLGRDAMIVVYRVVGEACTNIAKHAQATEVVIEVLYDHRYLTLQIKDNGVGFVADPFASGQYGFLSMRERVRTLGGSLDITSSPGHGTSIRVRLSVH